MLSIKYLGQNTPQQHKINLFLQHLLSIQTWATKTKHINIYCKTWTNSTTQVTHKILFSPPVTC